jgi:hypothetical protein
LFFGGGTEESRRQTFGAGLNLSNVQEITQAHIESDECEYVDHVDSDDAFRCVPVPGDKLVRIAIGLWLSRRLYFNAIPMIFVIRDEVTPVCADNSRHAAQSLDRRSREQVAHPARTGAH